MSKRVCLLAMLLYALPARAEEPEPAPEPAVDVPAEPAAEPVIEELSSTELESLGLDAAGPRVDTSLHFWGFADFNSSLTKTTGAAAALQGRYQTFYIGSLNLYLSKNLSETFRTMAEVRLTYLPNGSFDATPGGYAQTSTSVLDYANGQMQTRWGGIILQRVYLEWQLHRYVAVRGGQFLTPFGIWNVDHGSPVYIPVQRPLAITGNMFPERQTGLEVLGRWNANNENTFGYHLTLSNGTGPVSEYKDLDRNKAVGGRLYWEYFGKLYFRVGSSGYYGRDTDATPSSAFTANTIDVKEKVSAQSDKLSLAADLLLKWEGLHVQTEWVTLQRRFTKAGRVEHATIGAPVSTAASADTFSWLSYVLFAYRFGSWYGLTPYFTVQNGTVDAAYQALPDARYSIRGITGGWTVNPIASVVFKLEAGRFHFPKAPLILRHDVSVFMCQAAWAF